MDRRRFEFAQLLALLVGFGASPANAISIDSTSYGNELAGGLITVHYSAIFDGTPLETGSVTYTLLGDAATQTGYAPSDPNFTFSVAGDTFLAGWELVNTTAPAADPLAAYISKVEIDLRPSLGGIFPSLFDDGSLPSTPLSADGVLGVVPDAASTGPFPSSAVESNQTWPPGLVNLGDMYGIETLTWTGLLMLGPGQSYIWHDDTDLVVPEPSAFVLLATLGTVLLLVFRRHMHFA